jgi:hypothetical protein
MSCATTSEPNLFLRFLVQSAKSTEDPVGEEHHHRDEQEPDPEVPVLRVDPGELVARHHVDDGADDAAVEPACAAEDQDHQHVRRAAEGKDFERHGRSRMREERAGDPRHQGGDRVGLAQVGAARRADRRHAGRVLADAPQREPERRMNNSSGHQETAKQDCERIGISSAAEHVELEAEQRPHPDALQPVGAAGQVARAVRRLVQQEPEAERQHDEREVAEAHDDVAERIAKQTGNDCRKDETRERLAEVMLGQ